MCVCVRVCVCVCVRAYVRGFMQETDCLPVSDLPAHFTSVHPVFEPIILWLMNLPVGGGESNLWWHGV